MAASTASPVARLPTRMVHRGPQAEPIHPIIGAPRGVPPMNTAMRGRVMALYMAVFMGGTPLGAPMIGWIGSAWGPRWTILIGSLATGLAVLAAMLYLMSSQDIHLSYHHRPRPRLSLIRGELSEPVPQVAN